MRFFVEQRHVTKLRSHHWVRVAGPFETQSEADRMFRRLARPKAELRIVQVEV